ncbi:hypothetical protein, partial [Streptomyces sp. WM6386]|uniref:hypothetical protein n=1 Tax=Streptomyces sp. WM6386 TaxID=1415558 RepID=UPI001F2F86BB
MNIDFDLAGGRPEQSLPKLVNKANLGQGLLFPHREVLRPAVHRAHSSTQSCRPWRVEWTTEDPGH